MAIQDPFLHSACGRIDITSFTCHMGMRCCAKQSQSCLIVFELADPPRCFVRYLTLGQPTNVVVMVVAFMPTDNIAGIRLQRQLEGERLD